MSEAECECPFLRMAAEAERLLELGMEMSEFHGGPVRALLIGRMRQEYGCRGPRKGICPWTAGFYSGPEPQPSKDVPLLRGNPSGKETGQFL